MRRPRLLLLVAIAALAGALVPAAPAAAAVPDAPPQPTAVAGDGYATVSWSPPASDGGSAITKYVITAAPGGAATDATATQTEAILSGLSQGVSYTFTVAAVNADGVGPASPPSNAVVPGPGNDDFAQGLLIADLTGTSLGNNAGADKETGEPDHAGSAGGASVWYRISVPTRGLLTVDTEGSAFDTLLGVYTGNSVSGLTTIASDNDICFPVSSACGGVENRQSELVAVLRSGGIYRIAVDGVAGASDDFVLSWSFTADTTNPSASMTLPSLSRRIGTSRLVAVGWKGSDNDKVAHYDVQVRSVRWDGVASSWKSWLTNTVAKSKKYTGSYGYTYCFRVRAEDRVGNVSGWSAARCMAVPLKASQLTYSAGWASSKVTTAFGGEVRFTTTSGANAFRTGAQAERLGLVVTKCPTCGAVRVYWNFTTLVNIDLRASTTQRKVFVPIKAFTSTQSGSVTIRVISPNGRYVLIEGLGIYRD